MGVGLNVYWRQIFGLVSERRPEANTDRIKDAGIYGEEIERLFGEDFGVASAGVGVGGEHGMRGRGNWDAARDCAGCESAAM